MRDLQGDGWYDPSRTSLSLPCRGPLSEAGTLPRSIPAGTIATRHVDKLFELDLAIIAPAVERDNEIPAHAVAEGSAQDER